MCHLDCFIARSCFITCFNGFYFLSELTTAWKSMVQSKAAVSSPGIFCRFNYHLLKVMKCSLQFHVIMMAQFHLHLTSPNLSDVYSPSVVAAYRKPSRGSSRDRGSPGFCHGPAQKEILQGSPLQG